MSKIILFADKLVGCQTAEFLFLNYPLDVAAVVVTDGNSSVLSVIKNNNIRCRIFTESQIKQEVFLTELKELKVDYFILAWWPSIISKQIFEIPTFGTINFHPSYLPFNRGKHYNFWSIVEETVFGVTLHFVTDKIDAGDILFQKKIHKDWSDTGATLYNKAQNGMLDLFKESYIKIRAHEYERIKQDANSGSFHFAKELLKASTIDLEKKYTARELLNIFRAKTFLPYNGAQFKELGETYQIQINITKIVSNESD